MKQKPDFLKPKRFKKETEQVTRETTFFRSPDGEIKQTTEKKALHNPKKVVLYKIHDIELYVYPYDYPDKIFIGQFPNSIELDKTTVESVLKLYNIGKWFLNGFWARKPYRMTKEAHARRQALVQAYKMGLKTIKKARKR